MALVVEDGTGKADAESYVSVADADTYHGDRGNAAWALETDTVKEQVLRKGTDYLNGRYRFKGIKLLSTQALLWPRARATDEDGYVIDTDAIPQAVKDATAYFALKALSGELSPDLDRGGAVKREKVDVIETEYADSAPGGTVYKFADDLLSGLTVGIRLVRA